MLPYLNPTLLASTLASLLAIWTLSDPLRGTTAPVCLALAFGAASPDSTALSLSGSFPAVYHLQLTDRPARWLSGWSDVDAAREGPDSTSWAHIDRTYNHPWLRADPLLFVWKRAGDSLLLAGQELHVRGVLRQSTFAGRVVGSSDLIIPDRDPRANAYGKIYSCRAKAEATAADVVLRELVRRDVIDSRQNDLEIEAESAILDTLARRVPP